MKKVLFALSICAFAACNSSETNTPAETKPEVAAAAAADSAAKATAAADSLAKAAAADSAAKAAAAPEKKDAKAHDTHDKKGKM